MPASDTAHTSRVVQEQLLEKAKELALRRLGEVITLKFPPPPPREGAAMNLAEDLSPALSSVADVPSQWGGPHFGRRLSVTVGSLGIVEGTRNAELFGICVRDSKDISNELN